MSCGVCAHVHASGHTNTHTHTHINVVIQNAAIYVKSAPFSRLWVEVNLLFLSSASQVGLNNTWPVLMGYHCASVCARVCVPVCVRVCVCVCACPVMMPTGTWFWCRQISRQPPSPVRTHLALFSVSQGVLSLFPHSSCFTLFSSPLRVAHSSPPRPRLLSKSALSPCPRQSLTRLFIVWDKKWHVTANTPTHHLHKRSTSPAMNFYQLLINSKHLPELNWNMFHFPFSPYVMTLWDCVFSEL